MSGSKQVSDVQKRFAASTGYDYYWTLNKAIRAHASGAEADEVESILLSAANLTEEANNRAAFNVFMKRFGKSKSISAVKRSISRSFENDLIEVKFDPVFQIQDKSGSRIYAIWAMQTPTLEQSYAALACYMMQDAYRRTSLANSSFFFFDLVSDKLYSEKQITNSTPMVFRAELKKLADIVRQVNG